LSELAFLTIAEAAELVRSRKLSPVEYTTALLARIERIEPKLHAFVRLTPERALEAARSAESEIAAGRYRGSFHGIPYGLKDIVDAVGLPTTGHSKILIDNVAGVDASIVAKLRAAGAILLGKLSTHEFAIGGPSFDLPWPPARNPWHLDYFPGGSSSGSGVGLAAGCFPAAIGTDTGGSIRNPASLCGIVGMKPTYGLVSRRGVLPLSFALDHVGPMTRTVRDNALMLQLIAGHDERDPASADTVIPDYTAELDRGVRGLKIGVIRHFYTKDVEADPEQVAALETAIEAFAKQGALISEITLPPLADFSACGQIILAAEAYAVHEHWLKTRPEDYGARARERLLAGATLSAAHYLQAVRWRLALKQLTLSAFRDIDVAVTASSMDPACRIDDVEKLALNYWRQARMPFNVTGQPAVVIPAGFARGQLPLSLQIIGHPFGEATSYRVAQAYESTMGWVRQHPSLE
jgi:aspartyl-tRNA(Asn)/glutamyl-tRNA(Gln) amidotransferase subunit A